MSVEAVAFGKSLKLATLSTRVGAHEGNVGPLKSIGHTQEYTVAVYSQGMAPANPVEIREGGDTAPAPDGYKLVSRGECWVDGKKTKVIAVRKK